MSITAGYACRMNKDDWIDEDVYDAACKKGLEQMTLVDFCKFFKVGQKGQHVNKLKKHDRQKKNVTQFYPEMSSKPDSPTYPLYCRFSLMKYKEWKMNPNVL